MYNPPSQTQINEEIIQYVCYSDKDSSIKHTINGNGTLCVKSSSHSSLVAVYGCLFFEYLPIQLISKSNIGYYTYDYGIDFINVLSIVCLGDTYTSIMTYSRLIQLVKDFEKYVREVPRSPIIPELRKSLSCVYDCTLEQAKILIRYGYFSTKYYDKFSNEELLLICTKEYVLDANSLWSKLGTNNRKPFIIMLMYYSSVDEDTYQEDRPSVELPCFSIKIAEILMRNAVDIKKERLLFYSFMVYRHSLLNSTKDEIVHAIISKHPNDPMYCFRLMLESIEDR